MRRRPVLRTLLALLLGIPVIATVLLIARGAWGRTIYEKESLYHYIRVEQVGTIRTLYFRREGTDHAESAMNLADPYDLVMHHARYFFSAFILQPRATRILMVGLGGGTVPRVMRLYLPDAVIDNVELDPDVHRVAKEHFNFREDERMTTHIADGRVEIRRFKRAGKTFDIVILDAFRGGYIPFHLTTKEFFQECRQILADGGVIAANLRPEFLSYEYQRRTIAAVFPTQYAFNAGGNKVVVATTERSPRSREAMREAAEALQKERGFRFHLPSFLRDYDEKRDYPSGGDILTDDYAPVNILRGTRR